MRGLTLFVEVGPGKVLAGIQRKILPKDHPAQICNVGSLAQLEEFLKAPGLRDEHPRGIFLFTSSCCCDNIILFH